MKKLCLCIAVLYVIIFIGYGYLKYLNHHPIKMYHYFPQLTRKIPVLKQIDRIFCLSLGIDWYKVKHKKTGREYLMKMGYSTKDGKEWINHFWVMDNIKRDRWIEFTQDQFKRSFGDPTDGEGLTVEDR